MISKIKTICFTGIDVKEVDVEVHFAKGQPGITIVGLGDKAVRESIERVRASLFSIGLILPPQRITINLAPADILKEGTHYDLPIMLGILTNIGVIKQESVASFIVVGELGLDGSIRGVNGVLPASLYASTKKIGLICPFENGKEGAWGGEEMNIVAVEDLKQLIKYLKGEIKIERPQITKDDFVANSYKDMADVIGQERAKYAIEIAAAGGHNVLLIGSPGTGKTMISSRITTILPPLTTEEMIEVSMIHSVAGLIKNGVLTSIRPFRAPHNTASQIAVIGGGSNAKPGEITLAHNGVLFLDELPEFRRETLEALRQPLETGEVAIARTRVKVVYPARFQLIAAMNPCKCGFFGSKTRPCTCSQKSALQYQGRISGPLLDRIDMHVRMDDVNHKVSNIGGDKQAEKSEEIKKRVVYARQVQAERYKSEKFRLNSHCPDGNLLNKYCMPKDKKALQALEGIETKMHISMRGIGKIVRVARTIADLERSSEVREEDILRASIFRSKLA